jgi:hypothetical protein
MDAFGFCSVKRLMGLGEYERSPILIENRSNALARGAQKTRITKEPSERLRPAISGDPSGHFPQSRAIVAGECPGLMMLPVAEIPTHLCAY